MPAVGPRTSATMFSSCIYQKVKIPTLSRQRAAGQGMGPLVVELPGAAEGLGSVDGGNARNGGYHHAREKLHGGYIALVEGSGGGGRDFEHPKRTGVGAQGGGRDVAGSQAAAN